MKITTTTYSFLGLDATLFVVKIALCVFSHARNKSTCSQTWQNWGRSRWVANSWGLIELFTLKVGQKKNKPLSTIFYLKIFWFVFTKRSLYFRIPEYQSFHLSFIGFVLKGTISQFEFSIQGHILGTPWIFRCYNRK